jgi:hypothetical protein
MNCAFCSLPIEDHKAGHVMDTCIAATVFEFPVVQCKDMDEGNFCVDLENHREALKEIYPIKSTKFYSHMPVPEYSQSYGAVREVIDQLREKYYIDIGVDADGAQVQINRYEPPKKAHNENRVVSGGCWSVAVDSTRAGSMPEAVCKAALILMVNEKA